MTKDPKDMLRESAEEVISGKSRGFIIVGVMNKDGKLENQASVQTISVGDMAVATAGVIARVAEQSQAKK